MEPFSVNLANGRAVFRIVAAASLTPLCGLIWLLAGCDLPNRSSHGLPGPDTKIACIRSIVGSSASLFGVDIDADQVVGDPVEVGRADHVSLSSMAVAPNGKLYLLRDVQTGSPGRPYANRG